jgi:hypothetical protein
MAYQEITSASAVLNREIAATRNFFSRIADGLARAGNAISQASVARRRFELVQALQAKSDVELEALNIKRDDIVHHVFKDLFYI